MTPYDLIIWALAIGGAWLILSFCILVERWINFHMESLTQRRIGDAMADPVYRSSSSDRSNPAVEISSDGESGDDRKEDGIDVTPAPATAPVHAA
jgi:hypothetical protein